MEARRFGSYSGAGDGHRDEVRIVCRLLGAISPLGRGRPVRTLVVLAVPSWTTCVAKSYVCLVHPGKKHLLPFLPVYGQCAASFRAALSRVVCNGRLLRHETRGTHRPAAFPERVTHYPS